MDSSIKITAIVAASKNRAIGKNGDIPWRLPEDLAHFKTVTLGNTVIMGRKTWESLPKRPLPGRRNIVVTRNPEFDAPGAETALTPEEALKRCDENEKVFFIGGGEIYRQALPLCNEVVMTEVALDVENPDTLFPDLNPEEWIMTDQTEEFVSKTGIRFRFVTYRKK